jgi:hypothetical protein
MSPYQKKQDWPSGARLRPPGGGRPIVGGAAERHRQPRVAGRRWRTATAAGTRGDCADGAGTCIRVSSRTGLRIVDEGSGVRDYACAVRSSTEVVTVWSLRAMQ